MICSFPNYNELFIYVMDHPEYHEHFEDYSKTCHSDMKGIYMLLHNTLLSDKTKKQIIHLRGHRLNKRGGMIKMQSAYYMFIVSLRLILIQHKEKYEELHDMTHIINNAWHGVGCWKY